jgi:sec-independent protein translocase protein TatA
MGFGSIGHWLLVLLVVVLLFGSGKISSVMGDVAKGIKSFKKNMKDEDSVSPPAGSV